MVFSAYRSVGSGDLYACLRQDGEDWGDPHCILEQKDVPFHNHPDAVDREWGLEGAKVFRLSDEDYLLIGVCFLAEPGLPLGRRQRVFYAKSDSPIGPFKAISPLIDPCQNGENGHPDALIVGDRLVVVYQERNGEGQPWHLRSTSVSINEMMNGGENLVFEDLASTLFA